MYKMFFKMIQDVVDEQMRKCKEDGGLPAVIVRECNDPAEKQSLENLNAEITGSRSTALPNPALDGFCDLRSVTLSLLSYVDRCSLEQQN